MVCIAEYLRKELQTSCCDKEKRLKSLNMGYTLNISQSSPIHNPLSWQISDPVQSKSAWTELDYESSGLIQSIPYSDIYYICNIIILPLSRLFRFSYQLDWRLETWWLGTSII